MTFKTFRTLRLYFTESEWVCAMCLLQDTIPDFFKYSPNVDPMLLCSKPHVAINYIHAPDYVLQRRWCNLLRIHGRQLTDRVSPVDTTSTQTADSTSALSSLVSMHMHQRTQVWSARTL